MQNRIDALFRQFHVYAIRRRRKFRYPVRLERQNHGILWYPAQKQPVIHAPGAGRPDDIDAGTVPAHRLQLLIDLSVIFCGQQMQQTAPPGVAGEFQIPIAALHKETAPGKVLQKCDFQQSGGPDAEQCSP